MSQKHNEIRFDLHVHLVFVGFVYRKKNNIDVAGGSGRPRCRCYCGGSAHGSGSARGRPLSDAQWPPRHPVAPPDADETNLN